MSRWLTSRGLVSVLVVCGALAGLSRPADAKPKHKHHARTKSHADNMPRGWTWPPSRTMTASAKACEAKLDALGVTWKPAKKAGHIVDPVIVTEPPGDRPANDASSAMTLGGVTYVGVFGTGPFELDCQLALALQTVGSELYASGVREVRFGSIYRWSNIRVGGKTKPILSRHALGLAMDVVSFVDDSGREAVVAKDYKHGDELLLGIESTINSSGVFRTVLTPKNDPISHRDHFHLEANPNYSADYSLPSS